MDSPRGLPATTTSRCPGWVQQRSGLPRERLPLEAFVHSGSFGHPADFLTE